MNLRAATLLVALAGCSPLPMTVARLNAPDDIVSVQRVASFKLDAVMGDDGLPQFLYKGHPAAPTVHVDPGDTIAVDLHNELTGSGMGADINLHFHGLGVSPRAPSDDVLTMLAAPGQTLHYVVHVPKTQPPGLYWYHPHVHGETAFQVGRAGMSGAIVVGGIEKHFSQLRGLAEQIMIVREVGGDDGLARRPRRPSTTCASLAGDLTVNNAVNAEMRFPPGKLAFFGIVNATGDRTLDLRLDGVVMRVVGIDGFPVDTYAGTQPFAARHVVVPPAGRVEFAARLTAATTLRTLCYHSGPVGDPDPAQQLVRFTPETGGALDQLQKTIALTARASVQSVGPAAPLPPPSVHRVVNFGENPAGTEFFINGREFDPSAPPMFVARAGTVERWTVKNFTDEMHDFHIHQTHFLVTSVDGVAVERPVWSDTFVVPWRRHEPNGSYVPGKIEALVDFRSNAIRGTFVFHCHILDHEDHGMMAKILVR